MKILIAEDDDSTRLVLYFALKKFGHEITQSKDGLEAWDILKQPNAPKLVILDWMMPGMDGITLCKKIRENQERERPPYVIILTSKSTPEDTLEALHAGADEFLIKPINSSELRARIEVGKRIIDLQDSLKEHIEHLQDALDQVKTLQGFIAICSYCHKVRTETTWEKIENYIAEHADVTFSHGVCPDCIKNKMGPELEALKKLKLKQK